MKTFYIIGLFMVFFSCKKKQVTFNKEKNKLSKEILVPEFQSIINAANLEGAILIYDLKKDTYYSNDFKRIKKGNLPASTFKIPNSIIALETGVVENDSTLFKWKGVARRMKIWEQDLTFKEAFHVSCVPCYQDIARKIGSKRMNRYLNKLGYREMEVDATSIDMFWLEGSSKINQLQQIAFLKRFYQSELPISKETEVIMKRLMVIEETDTYKISGKTGWSIRNENSNGWFVGYVELEKGTYFFATNITPKQQFNMRIFPMIRKEITYKALMQMNIIN